MAVKPRDDDAFLREVDEELRKEQVSSFVTRYGTWLIGGAVLMLALIGGFIWWQRHQENQAGEASRKLTQVIEQLESNNARAAAPAIDELAASSREAYRAAGLFARANAQIATNAVPAAIATLRGIALDGTLAQPWRDAAMIRQTQLEYDQLQPAQVVQRLQPYAQAGNPWFGTAGEMMAIALMRQQRYPQAAQMFGAMARDPGVPESIKARAIQMASSLGLDAVQLDPTIEQAAPAAGGAAIPVAPIQGNDVAARNASQ